MANQTLHRRERLVSDAMELAGRMMKCGAEVRNVEKTVERLCKAYGAAECSVFAITSYMFATVRFHDGTSVNCSKRISGAATALYKLEEYNTLSRFICRERPKLDFIEHRMHEIDIMPENGLAHMAGCIIGAGSFTVFAGGGFSDCAAASLIGIVIFFCDKYIKSGGMNKLIYTLLMCAASGLMAGFLVKLGMGRDVDRIIIGDIMLFIPTLTLCNSVKDMLHGDILTGVYCFIDALLITLMIALGFYISKILSGGAV